MIVIIVLIFGKYGYEFNTFLKSYLCWYFIYALILIFFLSFAVLWVVLRYMAWLENLLLVKKQSSY